MNISIFVLRRTKLHAILFNSFLALALLWGPIASADPVDGVADTVLGQPNFTSAVVNNGGLSASSLFNATDVTVDAAGNAYVADARNNRVLIYLDPKNTDQVADIVLGQTDFVSNLCNFDTASPSASTLCDPQGLALDAAGNLYVADWQNSRVLVYLDPLNDQVADVVIGQPDFTSIQFNNGGFNPTASTLFTPLDVTVDNSGNVLIADTNNSRVTVYLDPLNGDTVADMVIGQPNFISSTPNNGGVSAISLAGPSRMTIDALGNVYIGDAANNRVLEYHTPLTTDTMADVVLGQADFTSNVFATTASNMANPEGVAIDTDGNIYVADRANFRVLIFDGTPQIVTPEADAGPDQTENEGIFVTLDGSASTNVTNYAWTQVAGPTVSLSSTTAVNPGFTTPYVSTNTTLTFQLIVDDGQGSFSDPDTVDISVVNVNNPPVADAGDDESIKEGAVVTLDGSDTFDPEGDTPLGYTWTQTSGPLVILSSNTVEAPSFTAPLGIGNVLKFELVADDGNEFSQPDEVVITVVENTQPIANAGPDQTVAEGSLVTLNGTGSGDPDGDGISFNWSGPVALDDNTSSTPSFIATPANSTFAFDLVVTDDDAVNPKSSNPDQVVINVLNTTNNPPNCELARAVCKDNKHNKHNKHKKYNKYKKYKKYGKYKGNNSCDQLWPPNHKMVKVKIKGVTDEDAEDNVTLQITGVTQDEPVNGVADGNTSPDAIILDRPKRDKVLIRAERSGNSNGRVYVVNFTASDGLDSCNGSVSIGVPHNRKGTPVDDGQNFDSTQQP